MNELAKIGKSPYQVLMREVSDTIQDLAMAYGERIAIESCHSFLTRVQSAENKELMTTVFRIFAIDAVIRDLGFYLLNGAINQTAAKALVETQKKLIKQAATNITVLLDSLNVAKDALYTPLSADYVDYYSRPNFGEAYVAKL
jgi:hypothetical protein